MIECVHGKITIGICAYNEEENIHKLLHNLLSKQGLFPNAEIFVECSGSTDHTPEIAKKFRNGGLPVQLIFERKRRGKADALNKIFKEIRERARNDDPLVLVNADGLPEPGSIEKLLQPFSDGKIGATSGRPVPINGAGSICNNIVRLIWDLHHRVNLRGDVKMSGELCAIRPNLVKEIPVNLATDEPYMEMLIQRQGYEIAYVPEAIVRIRGPDNLRELLNQRRRICVGHAQVKAMSGFVVSTCDVRNLIFLLRESLRDRPAIKRLEAILVGIFLEIFARSIAPYDLRRGKIPCIWEKLSSTNPRFE